MFEQVDDSTGRLLDVRPDAPSALPDLFGGSTTMLGSSNAIRKAVPPRLEVILSRAPNDQSVSTYPASTLSAI